MERKSVEILTNSLHSLSFSRQNPITIVISNAIILYTMCYVMRRVVGFFMNGTRASDRVDEFSFDKNFNKFTVQNTTE